MSDQRERDLQRLQAAGDQAVDAIVNWNKPSFPRLISELQNRLQTMRRLPYSTALNPAHLAVPQVIMSEDVVQLFRMNDRSIVPTFIVYDASGIAHRDQKLTLSARSQETDRERIRARWKTLSGAGAAEKRDLLWLYVDEIVSTPESKESVIPLSLAGWGLNMTLDSDYVSNWGRIPLGEELWGVENIVVVAYDSEHAEPAMFSIAPSRGWRTFVGADGSLRDVPAVQEAVQETVQVPTPVEQPQQSIVGKPAVEAPRRRPATTKEILKSDSLSAILGLKQIITERLNLGESKAGPSSLPNSEIVVSRGGDKVVRHPATVRSTDTDVALEIPLTEVAAMQFKKLCGGGEISADQLADALQTTSWHNRTDKVTVSVAHVGPRRRVFLSAVFDHFDVGQLKHRKDSVKISPEMVAALFDRLQKPETREPQVAFSRSHKSFDFGRPRDEKAIRQAVSTTAVNEAFDKLRGTVYDSVDLVTPRKQSGPKSKFERIHQQKGRENAKKQGKKK